MIAMDGMGIWALAGLAMASVSSLGLARLIEQRHLYAPGADRILPKPPELELPVERVEFVTRDNVSLVGWAIPGDRTQHVIDASPWILICHGNSGSIGMPARLDYYAALRQLGINILAFDYRGYGESSGKPTEGGLYLDADAAYRHLRETRGVPASRIIIFGHSLGSAVAAELAIRVPAAGLIMEGALTSAVDRAQEIYAWVPVRWFQLSRFASIDKVDRIHMPKLFLHAAADETIPFAHGRRLYEKAAQPKEFIELGGGHSDAFKADSATYFDGIARFVSAVVR